MRLAPEKDLKPASEGGGVYPPKRWVLHSSAAEAMLSNPVEQSEKLLELREHRKPNR